MILYKKISGVSRAGHKLFWSRRVKTTTATYAVHPRLRRRTWESVSLCRCWNSRFPSPKN